MKQLDWKRRTGIALALCLVAGASIGAEDMKSDEQALEDVHARMLELMGKVETRLKSIDELLTDAAACRNKTSAESAVCKAITTTRNRAQQNLDDIDEILRLSVHEHPDCKGGGGSCKDGAGLCRTPKKKSGGGSGSQSASPSNSPGQNDPDGRVKSALDKNGETTAQRESTPDGQRPGEQKAQGKAGQKPGDGTKPDSKDATNPTSPLASKADPRNVASGSPTKGATASVSTADAADRWGDLPVYARDVFRAQGGDALPMRYRDFIDGYYRRLNEAR